MENSVAVAHSAPQGDPGAAAGREEAFAHVLGAEQLLPAVCPLCAAPGAVSVAIGRDDLNAGSDVVVAAARDSVEAHYCEICAESLSRSDTRRLAYRASAVLVCAAVATALPLAFGSRLLLMQVGIAWGVALVAWLLGRTKWGEPVDRGVRVHGPPDFAEDTLIVLTRTRRFSEALTNAAIAQVSVFERQGNVTRAPSSRFALWLALGSLVWLTTIHHFGVAQVRVMVAGHESATLLVDSRKVFDVAAANSEDPRSGKSLSLLGGRRRLQLVGASGDEAFDVVQNIWPGETYLVGSVPVGKCLFLEERRYGGAGPHSTFVPLGSSGPVFRLGRGVDSWFVPLGTASLDEPPVVTSGGVRRALRLLPCGAELSRRGFKSGE